MTLSLIASEAVVGLGKWSVDDGETEGLEEEKREKWRAESTNGWWGDVDSPRSGGPHMRLNGPLLHRVSQ